MPGPEPVWVVEEGDNAYLVVDHRTGSGAARIEWWCAAGEVEGGLAGLFVLADSLAGGHFREFQTLGSVVARVERGPRRHGQSWRTHALRR
jgi:hypothetical protein